jgi:hypothetical protein
MPDERGAAERVLGVLRPYASNFSGTLGRGDLVIPQREIPRLVHQILEAVSDMDGERAEASELEVFQVLQEAQRLPSLQDQANRLRQAFVIIKR